MGAGEGNEIGELVREAMGERLEGRGKREDGECASTGRVPVDTDVTLFAVRVSTRLMVVDARATYGRGSDEIGVPGTVGNFHVVDAILLLALLAKDMAARGRQQQRGSRLIPCPHAYRYLDARTNRDMVLLEQPRSTQEQQQRRGGEWEEEGARRRWYRYLL